MKRLIVLLPLLLGCADSLRAAAVPAPDKKAVQPPAAGQPDAQIESFRKVLSMGHPGMRLHALANITQLNLYHKLDDSFLPIFKECAEDKTSIIRSVTARIVGTRWVEGATGPAYNPDAVGILLKLSEDEARDVRFNAIYYGLSQMKPKSDELVSRLLKAAVENRENNLYARITEGLKSSPEQTQRLLNVQLDSKDAIAAVAAYEIYEDLTGSQPPNSERFMKLPSSRPKLFIFKGSKDAADVYKNELAAELKAAGLASPDLFVSGTGPNYVLMLKTYLTEERLLVEQRLLNQEKFKITQNMWLTPELEIQIDSMRKPK